MSSRVTVKGQVTIPVAVRRRLGIKPGDRVDFAPTDAGGFELRTLRPEADLRAALEEIRRRRPIRGATTDEIMAELRDDW